MLIQNKYYLSRKNIQIIDYKSHILIYIKPYTMLNTIFLTLYSLRQRDFFPLPPEIIHIICKIVSHDIEGIHLLKNLYPHIISENIGVTWLERISHKFQILKHNIPIVQLINLLSHPNRNIVFTSTWLLNYNEYYQNDKCMALINIITTQLSNIMSQMDDISLRILTIWIKISNDIFEKCNNMCTLLRSGLISGITTNYFTFSSVQSHFILGYMQQVSKCIATYYTKYHLESNNIILDIIDDLLEKVILHEQDAYKIFEWLIQTKSIRTHQIKYLLNQHLTNHTLVHRCNILIHNNKAHILFDLNIFHNILNNTHIIKNREYFSKLIYTLIDNDIEILLHPDILSRVLKPRAAHHKDTNDLISKILDKQCTQYTQTLCAVKGVVYIICKNVKTYRIGQIKYQDNHLKLKHYHNILNILLNMIEIVLETDAKYLRQEIIIHAYKFIRSCRWYIHHDIHIIAETLIAWIKR